MTEKQKPRLRARFVVHSATRWATTCSTRYFLKYLTADWDENDADDDPVANLLYEVKADQIPSDFDFVHKDADRKGGGLFGEEGIEIEVFDHEHELELGQIIDLWIILVGRVEFL